MHGAKQLMDGYPFWAIIFGSIKTLKKYRLRPAGLLKTISNALNPQSQCVCGECKARYF